MENQCKIRTNATLYRVLLRLFCIFVLCSLFISTCEPAQSLSKTAFKSSGQLPILTLLPFLIHECGKGSRKPRLKHNPRGLMVTSCFYFNNAVILRVFLSRADIWAVRCSPFHDSNNIQDKSCIFLTISIIRTCSVFEVVTSLFFNRHKSTNVNKRFMNVLKRVALRSNVMSGPSWSLSPTPVSDTAQKANFLQENRCPVLSKIRRFGPAGLL